MWIDQRGSEVLAVPECFRLLAHGVQSMGFGRLGVSTAQAPVVVPVNYAVRDREVLVRIGVGFLLQAAGGELVAFEVDEIDLEGGVAWSVLVRGLATVIGEPTGADIDAAPTPSVPSPGDRILSIRPDVVTGRRFPLLAGAAPGDVARST
jgi:hypothetical protein